MNRLGILLAALLLSFAVTGAATAVADAERPDPAQRIFFNRLRTAVLGVNSRQMTSLVHPASLECIAEEDRQVYYGRVMNGLVRVLGRRQIIKSVLAEPVTEQELAEIIAGDGGLKWPVRPEEKLIVSFEKQGMENAVSFYISPDGEEWKWVHVCPRQ